METVTWIISLTKIKASKSGNLVPFRNTNLWLKNRFRVFVSGKSRENIIILSADDSVNDKKTDFALKVNRIKYLVSLCW